MKYNNAESNIYYQYYIFEKQINEIKQINAFLKSVISLMTGVLVAVVNLKMLQKMSVKVI